MVLEKVLIYGEFSHYNLGSRDSRYRYIGDDAPASKEQNGYSTTTSGRASSRVALYANGHAVGVTRSSNYASSECSYFGTDLMGTVRSSTTDSGNAEYYEYDVFGKPYGEIVSDFAYTGKPYAPVTGMYNYGYRDYVPQTARFTTIDPIRDGSNWFAYCNNEPVNFLDAWGLSASDAGHTDVTLSYTKNASDTLNVTTRKVNPDGTIDYANNGVTSKNYHATNNVLTPAQRNGPVNYCEKYYYYPVQYPEGTFELGKSMETREDQKKSMGEIKIPTNATQPVMTTDIEGNPSGEIVTDDGYYIHSGTFNTTWGCIKMSDDDVEELAEIINSALDNGGSATLTVRNGNN